MTVHYVLNALGGLALFVLGMRYLSAGLQKLAGERLRHLLERLVGNRLTAAVTGSILASFLQSGSAASILVIGFVNAGLLSLYQALAILIGTGLGTTITVQLIAFKPSFLALPLVFCGVVLKFFFQRHRRVILGDTLIGFGLLFLGLQLMEANFLPLREMALFKSTHGYLTHWRVTAVFLGGLLAFSVQSGSTAIGIVIALAGSGLLNLETSVAMVIGEVLGSATLAAIASFGGTLTARRTALIYGVLTVSALTLALLFLPAFVKLVLLLSPAAGGSLFGGVGQVSPPATGGLATANARILANSHTLFSVLNVLLFLPFIGFFTRAAPYIIPERNGEGDCETRPKYLDVRVLNTPSIALLQARSELRRMADGARSMLEEISRQFYGYSAKRSQRIGMFETMLDVLQRELSSFLVALARQNLDGPASLEIAAMLHVTNDLERIGDHGEEIFLCLRRKKEEKIHFSNMAMSEMKTMAALVMELVSLAINILADDGEGASDQAANLQRSIMELEQTMRHNHVSRLNSGKCSVLAGLLYLDMASAYAKIADNAMAIIIIKKSTL